MKTIPAMTVLWVAMVLGAGHPAHAEIIGVTYFSESPPPPTTLGPYDMTLFPDDPRPIYEAVTTVRGPFGQDLVFAQPFIHVERGSGGGMWPSFLSPDLYTNDGEAATLVLPGGTVAFDFWMKSGIDLEFVTLTADGETTMEDQHLVSQQAYYFGFYATEPGETIETITIEWWAEIYLGHFQIAIPEPASGVLFLFATAAFGRRRRSASWAPDAGPRLWHWLVTSGNHRSKTGATGVWG